MCNQLTSILWHHYHFHYHHHSHHERYSYHHCIRCLRSHFIKIGWCVISVAFVVRLIWVSNKKTIKSNEEFSIVCFEMISIHIFVSLSVCIISSHIQLHISIYVTLFLHFLYAPFEYKCRSFSVCKLTKQYNDKTGAQLISWRHRLLFSQIFICSPSVLSIPCYTYMICVPFAMGSSYNSRHHIRVMKYKNKTEQTKTYSMYTL